MSNPDFSIYNIKKLIVVENIVGTISEIDYLQLYKAQNCSYTLKRNVENTQTNRTDIPKY